ncbi:hypothetical protein M9Y10_022117 [Tritrichomonas musculus]|uniref:Initiator binding domain-containing protein n=1 Tax=Tritrichomonas musculus TaxID=1915356 RepID=A0ABR2KUN2_9EUKA
MFPGEKAVIHNEHACKTNEQFPQYWDILSDSDKSGYIALKKEINVFNTKRIFRDRADSFTKILQLIQKYAERKEEDDWKRFLVCGICWVENGIAVNIRQLKILISKCKSSINGSLQKLGYLPSQLHVNTKLILFPLIPFLSKNYNELRQWTIRFSQNYNAPNPINDYNQFNNFTTQPKSAKFGPVTDFIQVKGIHDHAELHPIPIINTVINVKNDNANSDNNKNNQKNVKKILLPMISNKNENTKTVESNIVNQHSLEKKDPSMPFIIIPPKFRCTFSSNNGNAL